jgi:hypothetical protein
MTHIILLSKVPILLLAISIGYPVNWTVSVSNPRRTSSSGAVCQIQSGTLWSTRQLTEQQQSAARKRKVLSDCYELAKARAGIDPKVLMQSGPKLQLFSAANQVCLKAKGYFSQEPQE